MRTILLFAVLLAIYTLGAKDCKRVVSLTPAVTEMIYALGAGNMLVARSDACDYPENAKKLPVAGKIGVPNVEKIIHLKADLVISDMTVPAAEWDLLQKMNIKCVLLTADKISSYCKNIQTLGCLLEKKDEAEKECQHFFKEFEQLKKDGLNRKKVSALILLGVNPFVSCNKNTFVSEIAELAGAANIAAEVKQNYFVMSTEFAIEKNPEIAVLTGMSGDFRKYLFDVPAWKQLKFIQKNSIIDSVPMECFCRLSPRTLQAVRILREAIDKAVGR